MVHFRVAAAASDASRTMSMPINGDPAMTRYLVETGVLCQDPVTIVDVGARWGFNAEWQVFGNALRVICFEPDAE
jgi:hypothetical protein